MNFDILQLNDMIVPELNDIAQKFAIKDTKDLSKQDLIYKILDAQALANVQIKSTDTTEPKVAKKRAAKKETPAPANTPKENTAVSDTVKAESVTDKPETTKAVAKADTEKPKKAKKTLAPKVPAADIKPKTENAAIEMPALKENNPVEVKAETSEPKPVEQKPVQERKVPVHNHQNQKKPVHPNQKKTILITGPSIIISSSKISNNKILLQTIISQVNKEKTPHLLQK